MRRQLVLCLAGAIALMASAGFVSAAVPVDTSPNISAEASAEILGMHPVPAVRGFIIRDLEAALPEVDSTSDQRVVNNTVRHQYRVLTEDEKAELLAIKDLGLAFIERIDKLGPSREVSIAKTNAEQAVMWAVKHITS